VDSGGRGGLRWPRGCGRLVQTLIDYDGGIQPQNARLIALAPDLALLCADMGEWFEDKRPFFDGSVGPVMTSQVDDLLARLTALEERFR
jgi:hypothetical protein